MRVRRSLLVAASVSALCAPTAALAAGQSARRDSGDHRIALFRSVGPVALGMTVHRVERTLGRPSSVERSRGRSENLIYGRRNLFISFGRRGHVETVSTGDPADRTAGGIHPGSTRAALLKAYPGIRRSWEGYHLVRFPARAPRSPEVQFIVVGGRVRTILINSRVDY